LNGQYWGVYEIREKVDDMDYFDYYYDADIKDSVQMLKTWGGTWAEYGGAQALSDWNNLKNYILTNNLNNPANYNYVASQLDLKSLADYMIFNSLTVCADWLNWNTMWWRGINAKSTQKKWKYCLWDMDATFKHYINYTSVPSQDANADPCDPQSLPDPGGQGHVPILNKLLQTNTFKQYYVMRYFDLLNNVLICQRMVTVLDSMINLIAPEMQAHVAKWGGSYNQWYSNYQDLRNFILQRCDSVVNGFNNCYNTTGPYKIKVNVSPPNAGMVQFNSLLLNNFVWTGNYPGNLDIILKGIPNGGYCFDHWVVQNHTVSPNVNNDSITINLSMADSIVAVFVPVGQSVSVAATPSYVCKGESLQLQVSPTGSSVVWSSDASLSCTSCSVTVVTPTANTTVSVNVSGGCINGGTTYIVKVYDQPGVISPDFTPASCAPYTTQIVFNEGNYFVWTPTTGLSCNTCSNPVIFIEGMRTYSVAIATDPGFRCADTSVFSVYLEALCPEVYIPDGFSPNEDGINDTLKVFGFTDHFYMAIYNRWGEKIFETKDPKMGWDGKYKGETVPSGVYAIIVSGRDERGNFIKKSGNINLFR